MQRIFFEQKLIIILNLNEMSYDLIYFLIPTIRRVNANVFYNLYLFQKQNFNKVIRIYLALTLHDYMEHLIFLS